MAIPRTNTCAVSTSILSGRAAMSPASSFAMKSAFGPPNVPPASRCRFPTSPGRMPAYREWSLAHCPGVGEQVVVGQGMHERPGREIAGGGRLVLDDECATKALGRRLSDQTHHAAKLLRIYALAQGLHRGHEPGAALRGWRPDMTESDADAAGARWAARVELNGHGAHSSIENGNP